MFSWSRWLCDGVTELFVWFQAEICSLWAAELRLQKVFSCLCKAVRLHTHVWLSCWTNKPPIMTRISITIIVFGEKAVRFCADLYIIYTTLRAVSLAVPRQFAFTASVCRLLSDVRCFPAALLVFCACRAKPNGSKSKKPKQGGHRQVCNLCFCYHCLRFLFSRFLKNTLKSTNKHKHGAW